MADAPSFRLYNSLTRQVEAVEPLEDEHLRFYACGPTVYTYAHIGNFRSFLTADLINRTAQALGWDTTFVSNVTDVGHLTQDDLVDPEGEDKMAAALEREGQRFANIYDLARYYTEVLLDDWNALNLLEPDVRPRATEHVSHQIKAVERLMERGHAYETDQGVYFSVDTFPDYGKLSGNQAADQLQATSRDTVQDPDKNDPRDFALWKKDPDHLMQWHSPWGWGFPGWHIECSAMSMAYLGDAFDLHTGGEDLAFPHHECEIAQNECLTGETSVRYWIHTRFLQVEGEKMSKSADNFFTVRDLIDPPEEGGRGVNPLALRYTLMAGQYRKPFNFTKKTLADSARIIGRYQDAADAVEHALQADAEGPDHAANTLPRLYDATLAAMCDDLNTPKALAKALEGVKFINGLGDDLNTATARTAQEWLEDTNDLLGIVWPAHSNAASSDSETDPLAKQVESLLDERAAAREAGNYERADAIRDQLDAMGIEVKDSADGTTWQRKAVL